MLNSRRAIGAAVFILLVIFLITRSHDDSKSQPVSPGSAESNSDASKIVGGSPAPAGHASSATTGSSSVTNSQGRPAAQKPMGDMTHMSTYDKLAYAYPYDIQAKLPAYIWQTWKWTPADGKFDFREQEASWTELHPGFIHEVITDATAVSLLRLFYASVPEVLEAYDSLPLPVLKADFFRYLILYARGGIYSDIDTYAIRSALDWIPEQVPRDTFGLVIGIEADPDRPDWADWYSRRIQFCQWTIQSKPGHPVLRDVITRITTSTLAMKVTGRLGKLAQKDVVDFTGPALWTDTVMDYLNDPRYFDVKSSRGSIDYQNFTGMTTSKRVGDVVVLPITSFSPGVGQMGSGDYDDPMAFVKHDFEGTQKLP